jgi:hypothetical protein
MKSVRATCSYCLHTFQPNFAVHTALSDRTATRHSLAPATLGSACRNCLCGLRSVRRLNKRVIEVGEQVNEECRSDFLLLSTQFKLNSQFSLTYPFRRSPVSANRRPTVGSFHRKCFGGLRSVRRLNKRMEVGE